MTVNVTAQMVNTLRQKTGVAMGKCKEALLASDGDQAKAEHWLRVQLPSHKPTAKVTGEGVIVVNVNDSRDKATIVELTSETDFTAKSERFLSSAKHIAELGDSGKPEPLIDELRLVFKENINLTLRNTWVISGGKLGTYVHSNGKLAVIVACDAPESVVNTQKFADLLKDLAMHVAGTAIAPVAIDRASVHHELVDAERKVIEDQFNSDPKNSKKPAEIKEKIITGKLNRFFQEKTLLEQPFVKDETKTVGQVISDTDSGIKVVRFLRRQLG